MIIIKTILALIVLYGVIFIVKKSDYDICYENQEWNNNAAFGKCGGVIGGEDETRYVAEECANCPYFYKRGRVI